MKSYKGVEDANKSDNDMRSHCLKYKGCMQSEPYQMSKSSQKIWESLFYTLWHGKNNLPNPMP